MRVTISAKVKINPTKQLHTVISKYGSALQYCIDVAHKNKIKNNIKLHHLVYYKIRKRFKLPSQLAVSCIKQAAGMMKKSKSKPIITKASIRYNFPRVASLKPNNILSLKTLKERQDFPFTVPDCYQHYFNDWHVAESLLYKDKKGRIFFVFTFSKEVNVSDMHSCSQTTVLGIDLGVKNLAVCSDKRFYNSAKVKQVKRKFKYLRTTLQNKGTRSAKRLLKKLSGREKRFMKWVNHNISKQIVSPLTTGDTIIMENLKGIRKINRGKRINYWISNWSFYQLQSFIEYKANIKGITFKKVSPRYTSQICNKCGYLGTRSKGCFSCLHCGFNHYNSDFNAALNLAHPMLVERQAAVTQPSDCGVEAKGTYQCAIEAEPTVKIPHTLV